MHRKIAVVAVLAIVALAGPAQAGIEDQLQISFRGSDAVPDEVHGLNNTLYFGDEGEQIRETADEDGDGTVSDAEQEAYLSQVRGQWEQDPPELEWTLDGQPVTAPVDPRVASQGLNTSIDDSQTVSIRVEFNATFEDVSHGNEHELVVPEFQQCRGAGGAGFPPEWSVGFLDAHSVEDVNVETNRLSDRVAAIPCQEDSPPELRVTFASDEPVETSGGDGGTGSDGAEGGTDGSGDSGERGSPALGAPLAVIGVLATAWLGRRRA